MRDILLAVLLGLLAGVLFFGSVWADTGTPQGTAPVMCNVRFTDNSGTSQSEAYKKLCTKVQKGQKIKLPKLPSIRGYEGIGWAAHAKEKKVKYKPGTYAAIQRPTTFFAVYRKGAACKVTYVMEGNKSNAAYQALNRTVSKGATIELPKIPNQVGYLGVGWKVRIGGRVKVLQPGERIKVTENLKFFASQKAGSVVVLYQANGKVYKTVTVEPGSSYKLPSMVNPQGYTFMGWSPKKNVRVTHSTPRTSFYEAGMNLTVREKVQLYPVLMDRKREESIPLGILSAVTKRAQKNYTDVILVGDSRMVALSKLLTYLKYYKTEAGQHVSIIAASGEGLQWFRENGSKDVQKKVEEIRSKNAEARIAVVFNLGVNDLENSLSYVKTYNSLAPNLTSQNCSLYFATVNPVNEAQMQWATRRHQTSAHIRSLEQVRAFNRVLLQGLSKDFQCIDTYRFLMSGGLSFDKGRQVSSGKNCGIDDGLHYSVNTYKWIFWKILDSL